MASRYHVRAATGRSEPARCAPGGDTQVLRQGAGGSADVARDLRRRLLAEHVGRSKPPFAAAMRAGAQTPFYPELATLTALFIEREDAIA
jgi:hypothetical protein